MALTRCQYDAYQRTLTTEVLACEPDDDGYLVQLAETILYATGGGQPADRGSIAGADVLDVFKTDEGYPLHRISAAVEGTVEVVVDWARRYDHMQQHTAQHLITAIAHDRFGWETTSFHLGEEGCTIDLNTSSIAADDLRALEAEVNAEVRACRGVEHRIVTPDELDGLHVRTRGLPDGHKGPVRLIAIDGLDLNTCGGTHVASTGELQTVVLLGTSKMRGETRLSYLAGERVLAWLHGSLARERALTGVLKSHAGEHVALTEKLVRDGKETRRKVEQFQGELVRYIADALLLGEEKTIVYYRQGAGAAFLAQLSQALHEARPEALCLLMTSAETKGAGLFVMVGPAALVKKAGPPVASLLEGRGGGPPGRYQGKVGTIELRDDAGALLSQIARSG